MLKFLIAVLLLLPAAGWSMGNAPSAEKSEVKGKPAPDFTLMTASGATTSMSKARNGQKAVIFFWATWCPHCHDEIIRMNDQIDAINKQGIKILLVDIGESAEEVKSYLHYNNVKLDSFVDPDTSLQEPYNIIGVPTLYFVDEQGNIRDMRHQFPDNYAELFAAP